MSGKCLCTPSVTEESAGQKATIVHMLVRKKANEVADVFWPAISFGPVLVCVTETV